MSWRHASNSVALLPEDLGSIPNAHTVTQDLMSSFHFYLYQAPTRCSDIHASKIPNHIEIKLLKG